MPQAPTGRVPRGALRNAMVEFLRSRDGAPAPIAEIHAAVEKRLGVEVRESSVRGGLQHEALFKRVSRGVFKLR